jgi:ABC-type transporter MlaC component
MRTIGVFFGITALAAVVFSPLPAAAFGIHLGPFHFGLGHHHHRHHLHMRTNPNEARTRPNDVSRGGSYSTAARGDNAAKTDQADRETRVETNSEAFESCAGLAQGVTNLPIDQIRQTVHPTADQEAALEDLSATSSLASDIIKSCPASAPLTPVGRLDAAEQRLDATIKAIHILRSPLERFYRALSDEQRRQFNAINGSTEGARSTGNMATLCGQQAGSFINLPVQRIEQVVQPTAQQQSAFDDLKKAAQKAGDQLQSSCPTAVPKSPVWRLDTVETRLGAMVDAIEAVRPNLKNFYASLSDEQKARFNLMGPPPRSASSPSER